MGLLNSALQIGRSALMSYQGALQAVGSNISSAGSPDYTRLAPHLDPIQGSLVANELAPGGGVALTDIQRVIDDALEGRLRLSVGAHSSAATLQTALARIESFFDDVSGAGVSSQMSEFFRRFADLQNTPEDLAMRDLVIAGGLGLAESLRSLRSQLTRLGEDLDGQIRDVVSRADQIARQVAELNVEITTAEAGRRSQATALRDQRDALLRQLSEIFDVTVREQPDGAINVYIGSEALVQGGVSRGLVAVAQVDGRFQRSSARFADTQQQVEVRGGQLAGLVAARDVESYGRIASLDELAAAIIQDVNEIHADGQGLTGLRSVTGTYHVLDATTPLDSPLTGLARPPAGGSFYLTVVDDATAAPVAYRIDVTLDGTPSGMGLQGVVDAINAQVTGVSASVTSDQRLSLNAAAGFSFVLGYDGQSVRADTTGLLAALGINTFFTGSDAGNMGVNPALAADPRLVAAATVFLPGDGLNAGRIAALDVAPSTSLGGTAIPVFFRSLASEVAGHASDANAGVEASAAILSSLQAQKESISGVNLDEEAIALLKYERAFQGATRYVTVVERLLDELVALIR